ncbi:MAG: hypothetical protein ACLFWD_11105 [Anaerolineales bacterium]
MSAFNASSEFQNATSIVEKALSGLSLSESSSFSITALVQQIGEGLSRQIALVPWRLKPLKLFGFWITYRKGDQYFDYIIYEEMTARIHQEHIILHELAHILLGHHTYELGADPSPNISLLARSIDHSEAREAEAERLANQIRNLIIQHVGLTRFVTGRSTTSTWISLSTGLRYDR